jgi:hypothetical protein
VTEPKVDPLAPSADLRRQAYQQEAASLEQTAQRLTLQIEALQRDLAAVTGRHQWVSGELAKLG